LLIVVDIDASAVATFPRPVLFVEGNATEDATLHRAGIAHAAGLITAVATDADNVFVTLSARALRPDMPIVARANHDNVSPKLRRAGATQVVSPYAMAGQQMAILAAKPASVDFVDTLLRGVNADLVLEDVRVKTGSQLVGIPLSDARRQYAKGAVFLAIQRDGRVHAPPPIELDLAANDVVAVVGTTEQLRAFEEACQAKVTIDQPAPFPA
jgi:voltage-gated potassium channel